MTFFQVSKLAVCHMLTFDHPELTQSYLVQRDCTFQSWRPYSSHPTPFSKSFPTRMCSPGLIPFIVWPLFPWDAAEVAVGDPRPAYAILSGLHSLAGTCTHSSPAMAWKPLNAPVLPWHEEAIRQPLNATAPAPASSDCNYREIRG